MHDIAKEYRTGMAYDSVDAGVLDDVVARLSGDAHEFKVDGDLVRVRRLGGVPGKVPFHVCRGCFPDRPTRN